MLGTPLPGTGLLLACVTVPTQDSAACPLEASPAAGGVTAQAGWLGFWSCGSPPRLTQLRRNWCSRHVLPVPAPTVLSGTCAVPSVQGCGQSRRGDQDSGTDGVRMERRSPIPLHPSFTNCFCCHRCFPRAKGWGAGAPHRGNRGCDCSPGLGVPLFYFLSLPSPVCSSRPALVHPSCTRCAAHRREELGVLPASL